MGRIWKCYFCSSPCYPGHGLTFVRNDCKVFRFCKSKCHKNFRLRRNPRRTRWTKAFRWSRNKEMNNDNVLHFEKKRQIPTRYNRELMAKTIKAMHRLGQIRVRRFNKFYANRFKGVALMKKRQALRLIRNNLHMVVAPVALKGDKSFKNWRKAALRHLEKKKKAGTLRLE